MDEITNPTTPKIGKMRRARLIKEGYTVQCTNSDTGKETWLEVVRALHILAPLKVTRLYLSDGEEFGMHADDLVMSRTPGEQAKADAAVTS